MPGVGSRILPPMKSVYGVFHKNNMKKRTFIGVNTAYVFLSF